MHALWHANVSITGSPVVGGGRVWSLDPAAASCTRSTRAPARSVAWWQSGPPAGSRRRRSPAACSCRRSPAHRGHDVLTPGDRLVRLGARARPRDRLRCPRARAVPGAGRRPGVTALVCAPGNAGTAAVAEQRGVDATDPAAVAALARDVDADLVVVGPEAPLVAGVADAVRAAGIACFGPSGAAAQLEGSKAFAKDVMAAAGVPTAAAAVCTTPTRPRPRWTSSGRPTSSRTTAWPPARASSSPPTATRRWRTRPRASGSSSRSSSTAPRSRCSASPTGDGRAAAAGAGLQAHRRRRHRRRTPAAWGPTRRCRGCRPSSSTTSCAPVAEPTVAEMARRGTPVRRPALRRPGDHRARPAGRRVQRPLRRSGDPGRAGRCSRRRSAACCTPRPPARWPRSRRCAGAPARR